MAQPIRLRFPATPLAMVFLLGGGILLLQGCHPGSEITEYQAPAQILRAFRSEHPGAQAITYRQMTKDGFKVYLVQYLEGEEEKEAYYNVQGKAFVSKAERRMADQETLKKQEEAEARVKEEAEEKAAQSPEKTPDHQAQNPPAQPKKTAPHGNQTVP